MLVELFSSMLGMNEIWQNFHVPQDSFAYKKDMVVRFFYGLKLSKLLQTKFMPS
jgi:hypothetical protein